MLMFMLGAYRTYGVSLRALVIAVLYMALGGIACATVQAQETQEGELRTVVIDAGHGGKDPGTQGSRSREKDVTLAVALKLGGYIQAEYPNVKVIFTRDSDVFIPLNRRSEIANKAGADLFISIHCNSAPSPVAVGAETFVMGLNVTKSNLEVAQRENAVITYEDDYTTKYEGYDPKSPESFIIFSLMQNVFLSQSLEFAGLVQDEFETRAKRINRGVKQERFLVLYKGGMPSVLIELGFLSHPKEEAYLLSETGQAHMASAIFRAFKRYKKSRDMRSVPHMMALQEPTEPTQEPTKTTSPTTKQAPASKKAQETYRIQVATVSSPIPKNHKIRRDYPRLIEEKSGSTYRYYSHETTSQREAESLLLEVRKKYRDAFIVRYKNGKRTTQK